MATQVNLNALRDSVAGVGRQQGGSRFPGIVYVPDGVSLVRFYADPSNKILRTFKRHKKTITGHDGKKYNIHLQCLAGSEHGCSVCDYVAKKAEEYPGYKDIWEYQSKNSCIAYTWIFEYIGNNEFVKTGVPIVMMGSKKFATELSERIGQLPDDILQLVFTPEATHSLWEVKSKDLGREAFSISMVSWKQASMPPLPDDAPSLSEIYYKENEPPAPDLVASFLKLFNTSIGAYARTLEPTVYAVKEPPLEETPRQRVSHEKEKEMESVKVTDTGLSLGKTIEKKIKENPTPAPLKIVKDVKEPEEEVDGAPPWDESKTKIIVDKDCFSQYRMNDISQCIMCDVESKCKDATIT